MIWDEFLRHFRFCDEEDRSEKDQKIAQSTHENGYIKPRKTFWRNSKQLLSNRFSLQDMIEWAIQRDPWSVTEKDIEKGFQNIFHVEESNEGIDCYRGYEWELIRIDLKAMADEYFSHKTND